MYFNMKHNKQKQIRAVFCCLNSTDMKEVDHQMQVHGFFSTKEKYPSSAEKCQKAIVSKVRNVLDKDSATFLVNAKTMI